MIDKAEILKTIAAVRIREIGRRAFGSQRHVRRHMCAPALHRAADDAKIHPRRMHVSRDRQPVGSGPQYHVVYIRRHAYLTSLLR